MDDDSVNLEMLANAAEQIIGAFDRLGRSGHVTVDARLARNQPTLGLLHAWTGQAFEYGRAALPLVRARSIAQFPLVREALEVGVRVQWVRWIEHAEAAVVKREAASRRALANDIAGLTMDAPTADLVQKLREQAGEDEKLFATLDLPKHMPYDLQSVCGYFHGGDQMYVFYRLLSLESHPTARSADKWLGLGEDGNLELRIPEREDSWGALLLVAALTTAATGFLDILQPDKSTRRFRNLVNRAARQSGLSATRFVPK